MDDQDATPPHTHSFDEVVIITGGSGVHVIDNEEYPLIRGDAFVIRGEHVHLFRNVEGLRLVNSSYFTQQFRKVMNMTPRAYIARQRALQP